MAWVLADRPVRRNSSVGPGSAAASCGDDGVPWAIVGTPDPADVAGRHRPSSAVATFRTTASVGRAQTPSATASASRSGVTWDVASSATTTR